MSVPALIRAVSLDFDSTSRFADAIKLVAQRIRVVTNSDIGAVYLKTSPAGAVVLRASDKAPGLVDNAALQLEAAHLAQLVTQRRESIQIADLARERPIEPKSGDVAVNGSLLAAPVVHRGQTVGALLLASEAPGHFNVDAVDFLLTGAARIAGRVSRAMIREDLDQVLEEADPAGRTYVGAASAPGLGIGHIVVVGRTDLVDVPDRRAHDIGAEVAAIRDAVAAARSELERFRATSLYQTLDADARAIFDVYHHLLGQRGLVDEIIERIHAGSWARGALREVIQEKATAFERLEDSYLRARAEDFREIGRRILQHLETPEGAQRTYPDNCILAAEEVGIVEIARVPREYLRGLVSRRGSVLSHASVLARALNIPAVMGLADLPLSNLDGCQVVVDGHQGKLVVKPSAASLTAYRTVQEQESRLAESLSHLREQPAVTPDGVRVGMYAKAGMLADLEAVGDAEVEGIGLYRTEYNFMTRSSFPSEQEQVASYRHVLEAMAPRPVTMRTLDAGGDKSLPYFWVEERNPFLGWRGIRMSLDHPEFFLTQVRAMLIANQGLGNLRIMFPMIASVGELDQALVLLEQAKTELAQEGSLDRFQVGIMIEVPAAVYQVEAIARRVDFISIGTNDLVQYLLAVDRDNARVANHYDTLHPAVVAALNDTCKRAHRSSIPVGVCGEMAGEVEAAILFMGMGVSDLSASPGRLPYVKAILRQVTSYQAQELLNQALTLETGAQIRALLRQAVHDAGLAELVSTPLVDEALVSEVNER